jgi:hypothetical protein
MRDVYTEEEKFAKKQELASPSRYYGEGGTIHENTELSVETCNGAIVSVWFRRQALPYKEVGVDLYRANEMAAMYASDDTKLTGVEILD